MGRACGAPGVSGAAEARFADVSVRFSSPREGVIEGTVQDGGGSLAASGTILIERDRFNAELKLSVRGDDPQQPNMTGELIIGDC